MTYTTLDRLTKRFGERTLIQLTDRGEVATGVLDVSVVDKALTDTDAEINGFLAVRYRLPLSEVPDLVADLALVIAIYKLHVFAPDPKIDKDYERALKRLSQIADGTVKLNVAGVEPPSSGAGGVVATDRERPLTPENLHGFI